MPTFSPYIVPITLILLTALFAVQFNGTTGIGAIFGPLLLVWFITIAALGVVAIAQQPGILAAFDPSYGARFPDAGRAIRIAADPECDDAGRHRRRGDVCGPRSLRRSADPHQLVCGCLSLASAQLSRPRRLPAGGAPVEGGKLFYNLAPHSLLVPLVVLATLATIVASQALISAAFSLASQAVGLGLFPRLTVRHTHHAHSGQIHVPFINWALYIGCVALVLVFRSATELAAAYGLAVAGVMLITSVAMFAVARRYWDWGAVQTTLVWGALIVVNGTFLVASSLKFLEGGFIPLGIGIASFLVMATWR